ncbi:MAG: triose-phosphate isomerase [Candidatus Shapirobacteria bacterium]
MILINYKIYRETFGNKAIELAKIIKEVGDKYKIRTVVTTSALDALKVQRETGVEVWLQNVDEFDEGKHTGWISAQQAYDLGIKGSLINHSEHKIPKGKIAKIIKSKPADFEIMCCVASVSQIKQWTNKLKPEWVLYEPPELIASKDKSVATENPDMIKSAAQALNGVKLLVGAGVKSRQDVKVSLNMGAKGVGLASAFVLNNNPQALLEEIASGFDGII